MSSVTLNSTMLVITIESLITFDWVCLSWIKEEHVDTQSRQNTKPTPKKFAGFA